MVINQVLDVFVFVENGKAYSTIIISTGRNKKQTNKKL
tara:strand:- start:2386 stop:2499 length:114 start_codon:yes stop_codon:yes gene_type:complete